MSFPCTVNYVLPYAMEFSKQRSFAVLLTIIQVHFEENRSTLNIIRRLTYLRIKQSSTASRNLQANSREAKCRIIFCKYAFSYSGSRFSYKCNQLQ
uniref:Uncharacterized protein n=1 Tax=Helianthus annuus TaxID=4232 RepID=A0A251UFJ0_HELAN